MNYLAGPVTRTQIPALNAMTGIMDNQKLSIEDEQVPIPNDPSSVRNDALPVTHTPSSATLDLPGTTSKPAVSSGVGEYILPDNLTLHDSLGKTNRYLPADAEAVGVLYRPVLLAQAEVQFVNRKYNLDHATETAVLVPEPDPRGMVRWEEYPTTPLAARELEGRPARNARYIAPEAALADAKQLRSLKTDFTDWIYRSVTTTVKANEKLKVYGGPEISETDFQRECEVAASALQDVAEDKIAAQFTRKIDSLETKLQREERELADDEADYSRRKREETVTHAETLISLFSRRRKSVSSSMSKRRMTEKAREDVEESKEEIERLMAELKEMEADMKQAMADVAAEWADIAADVTEISVTPYKKDINVLSFGVAWFPYHLVDVDGRLEELPAYG